MKNLTALCFSSLCLLPAIANEQKPASNLSLTNQQPSVINQAASPNNATKGDSVARKTYIVRFADNPVATYEGGVSGLKATSNKITGANKLDVNSKNSKAYRKYLKKKQEKFTQETGTSTAVKADYQYIFNGLAIELTEAEADALAQNPDVISISAERMEVPLTDNGPALIGADIIWQGPPNNVPHTLGEGLVIAVLDTGINNTHPSFADIGGDGYDHTNPLGSGNYIPGSYCDTNPDFCNDKLIGAWSFVSEAVTPADSDGHGSHTASTAAGNVVKGATLYAPTTSLARDISGVAPHANIIAYDVCIQTCPGSALLAAVEQVVIDAANLPDGIHALNYSISGGNNPYNDAVEIGFLNATAAGVYVAASAGNSGPGASTTGHNSPWVSTTASMTHERRLANAVTSLTSDDQSLPDISGLGFTASYGPAPIINSADLEADFPGSTLCGLGGLGSFIPPWPPGTFNGEIIACTRGVFGRVEKGANVLAAGAGGYILMDNGGGLVGDAHALPAVHISQSDGATLATWLASNPNPMGMIQGTTVEVDAANADIMAGSSSRGPNLAVDIIKPDVGAPGVSIMAAAADGDNYMFLSGTSMSSPHNAGAGAIVSGARPGWSPYAVKSAIMMTAKNDTGRKEDGVTSADPFDFGAGRVDLSRATEVGLVLNETPDNFWFANPAFGGDPKELNIASMQNSNCVGTCSWTRTFSNVTKHTIHVELSVKSSGNVSYSVSPSRLKVKSGKDASFTVTASNAYEATWDFAELTVARKGDGPDLHMPIALKGGTSTNPAAFTKSVDKSVAANGDNLHYTINIGGGKIAGEIDLSDILPEGIDYVPNSAMETITNGTSTMPFEENNGVLTWSGMLDEGEIAITPDAGTGYGYVPLSLFVAPFALPSNCDDGGWLLNTPAFDYNGQTYNQVIWSTNGTIEAGIDSLQVSSPANGFLPNPTPPNNLIAPWWTDLNLCAGGNWYVADLSDGVDSFTVFEWEDVPLWSDNSVRATFQIWLVTTTNEIFFVYGGVAGGVATIAAENDTGTLGDTFYFNGNVPAPAVNESLRLGLSPGGSAVLEFDATANCDSNTVVNQAEMSNDGKSDRALAVTEVTGC